MPNLVKRTTATIIIDRERDAQLAQLRDLGIAVQSDLIESGEMPDRPTPWVPADFANRFLVCETASVELQEYYDKRAQKMRFAVRFRATDPATAESRMLFSGALSIAGNRDDPSQEGWYQAQFAPVREKLPPRFAIFVEAAPSLSDPAYSVYTFR